MWLAGFSSCTRRFLNTGPPGKSQLLPNSCFISEEFLDLLGIMTKFFYICHLSLFSFHRGTLSGCDSNQLSSHTQTKSENGNLFLPAPSQCFPLCHIALLAAPLRDCSPLPTALGLSGQRLVLQLQGLWTKGRADALVRGSSWPS